MEVIRRWQKIYILLFIFVLFFTGYFSQVNMLKIAFVFACGNIVLLILFIKQNKLLKDAMLICDNCILKVISAIISTKNGEERGVVEETIISVFGILIGSEVYKWGSNGLDGVRLCSVSIEKVYIHLTFGDDTKTTAISLLHGLINGQDVFEMKERIWQETGVMAKLNGW